ncbi:methyltransferase domain-containing protein [Thermococcus argininiproducens]|uniref:Methyltransferase domain-containing protein n=1 Tax=Thermococcus argininiproducens TaxID=2866384 RepID=A0A9E7MBY7_9EURY|nr:methyltransferase domain-containing protein [Thermococcus argininiproducens]USH00974.1 methyltransferase domain-containing protein [Thermococcus argininiproducens]
MEEIYFLTFREARRLLLLSGEVRANLDLRKTNRTHTVVVKENKVIFPNGDEVEKSVLKKIAKDENTVYFIKDGHVYKAAIARNGFYKLVPTIPPTIEINGIRMHRTKDTNPLKDTRSKVDTVNPQEGDFVLDTCMGLGYTAIESAKRGAYVMTIEKDPNVIELAHLNPWSSELFSSQNIQVIQGDAFEIIRRFSDKTFDIVIHDPPRFSLAGHLYSEEFYKELFRVLKPKGRVFHYVGKPGGKYRRKDLQKGVMERLRKVGFIKVRRAEEALGVVAFKP